MWGTKGTGERKEFSAKTWLKIKGGVLILKLLSRSVPTHLDYRRQDNRQKDSKVLKLESLCSYYWRRSMKNNKKNWSLKIYQESFNPNKCSCFRISLRKFIDPIYDIWYENSWKILKPISTTFLSFPKPSFLVVWTPWSWLIFLGEVGALRTPRTSLMVSHSHYFLSNLLKAIAKLMLF